MSVIIDNSGFEYVTVSESCLFARGPSQDAILDLKTRKLYNIQKSDFERFATFESYFLASGPTQDAILDLKTQKVHSIEKKDPRSSSKHSSKLPFSKDVFEALLRGLDVQEWKADQGRTIPVEGNELNLFLPQDLGVSPDHLEHLCIEIIDDCNLDCIFCSKDTWFVTRNTGCRRSPASTHNSRTLGINEWKEVLQDAVALGCTSLLIQGGEPLLHPQLTLDLLQYAQDLGIVHMKLWTNATLLTQEIIDRLQMLDVDLVIQVFSVNPENHEAITGNRGTFNSVMEHISYVAASWIPFTVVIPECNAGQKSQDQGIQDVIAFIADLGRHDTTFSRQRPRVQIPPLADAHGPNSVTVTWQGDVFPCSNERLHRLENVRKTPLSAILCEEKASQRRADHSGSVFTTKLKEKGEHCPGDISLEDQILVHLSRVALVPEVLTWVHDRMLDEVNWDAFLFKARQHRISGLIYHHFVTHRLPLPSKITSQLYWDTVGWRGQARAFFQELALISGVLANLDIPVVLLNEPVLVHLVDRSPSVRMFGSIDLVTPSKCVSEVEAGLHRLGYAPFVEESNGQFRELTVEEVPNSQSRTLHRVGWMRTNTGCFVDVRPSDLRVGCADYCQIIKDSRFDPAFGRGLRIPSQEDIVLHQACEFYRHYRCNHHVGDLVGTLHQIGILKYLSDIYACLRIYLSDSPWSKLITRAKDLHFRQVLCYAFYYLDLVYGKGTVPEDVLDELHDGVLVEVPMAVNDSVSVGSIEDLLKSEIRTSEIVIDPVSWRFQCRETYEQVIEVIRTWKANGNLYPAVDCLQVNASSDVSADCAWNHADRLLMDETQVDPRQFFLTHVTSGERPREGIVQAQVCLLWDCQNFYVRARVSADEIHYVPPDYIPEYGEQVVLYVSDVADDRMPAKRIGVAIGQEGCVGPAKFYQEWSYGEAPVRDIALEDFQISVEVSKAHYQLDMTIPWKALEIAPHTGLQLGFDVEVFHQRASMNVETVLAWAGGQGLSMLNPVVHGTVTLIDGERL